MTRKKKPNNERWKNKAAYLFGGGVPKECNANYFYAEKETLKIAALLASNEIEKCFWFWENSQIDANDFDFSSSMRM